MGIREGESAGAAALEPAMALKAFGAHRHGANTTRQTPGREHKGENYEKTPEVKSEALSSRWEGLWEK